MQNVKYYYTVSNIYGDTIEVIVMLDGETIVSEDDEPRKIFKTEDRAYRYYSRLGYRED